jgi:hypothetical protein
MEKEKKKPPIATFRLGQVKASVWSNRNQSKNKTYYSVTVTRSYTDQNGQWQDTGSFMAHHIPLVLKVLEHAYAYVYDLQRQGANVDEYGDAGPSGPVPFDVPDENPAAYAQS